jgi:pimeloyl-ACP methyl ester carboxylesterase
MPSATGLYYFAHGEDKYYRPPVVFIHGAGGCHLSWPPQARRMTGERILAVDLPGHGKSEGIGCQTIPDYVTSLLYFLDGIKLPRAVFVGHSMGSAIAMTLALRHPDRVMGLGLIGGGARLRVSPAILETALNPATFELAIQSVHEGSFSAHADPRLVELSKKQMREVRPSVLHGDFMACDAFDQLENISQIAAPTLIVCGSEDRMTPPRFSEYLAQKILGAHLVVVPDAGHMVQLEKPEEVAGALAAFLKSIPYQPGG